MRVLGWLLAVALLAGCSGDSAHSGAVATLSVRLLGDGAARVRSVPLGIDCPDGCSAPFPLGTRIEVTAQAGARSTLQPWQGCPSPRGDLCQITLTQDTPIEIRADLDTPPGTESVRLQIDRRGSGRVVADLPPPFDCGSVCRADVPKQQSLVLTAVPDHGNYFAGWGGACQGTERTCEVWTEKSLEVVALFSPQVCLHRNFCWDNPIPTGRPATGLFAIDNDDIWAATDDQGGSLLRWNGIGWMAQPDSVFSAPTRATFRQFWASSRSDIWAIDNHGLWHFDGATYSPQALSVSGLGSVHGRAGNDVWVVGAGGVSMHFDGSAWTPQPTGVSARLTAVWVAADGTAWAGGEGSTLLYWDGVAWSRVVSPLAGDIRKIAGSSATDVWAVVSSGMLHFDGKTWSNAVTAPRLTDIQVLAPDNIWGHNGAQVHHSDGTGWLAYTGPRVGQMVATKADVWVFEEGTGQIFRKQGTSFSALYPSFRMPTPIFNAPHLWQVWMSDPDNAWAVGDGGALLHYDGAGWTQQSLGSRENLYAVHGSARNDVWVAGQNSLWFYDGATWSAGPLPALSAGDRIIDVHKRPGSPVFLMGQRPNVYLRSEIGFSQLISSSGYVMNPPTSCLFGLADGTTWAALNGKVYRWNEGRMVDQGSSYGADLACGGGVSATDVWFNSTYGYHWYHHNGSRVDQLLYTA
ncbi:MAG TPA: hypothetical protein PKI03_35760, partial [Pseudomonadota bacterium]|nr:hypothetical protein [Pseudomonadota bacterium]